MIVNSPHFKLKMKKIFLAAHLALHFVSNPIKFSRFSFKQLWVNKQQARFAEGLTFVGQE